MFCALVLNPEMRCVFAFRSKLRHLLQTWKLFRFSNVSHTQCCYIMRKMYFPSFRCMHMLVMPSPCQTEYIAFCGLDMHTQTWYVLYTKPERLWMQMLASIWSEQRSRLLSILLDITDFIMYEIGYERRS